MSSAAGAEVDPSVCYRHPDRTSWTLCERCGRTICPECQILTPSGVRCPDCVRELGGSVQWAPAGGTRTSVAQAKKRRATRARVVNERPRWQQVILGMLRPGDEAPVITWTITGLAVAAWVAGIFSPLIFFWISAYPAFPWQIWRYFTAIFAYPPIYSVAGVASFLLSVLFFLLSAPRAEREYGRRHFFTIVLVASVAGAVCSVLFGTIGYGLFGALFGIFASYLIAVWPSPQARTQLLIMLAIYVLIVLVFSPSALPELIGGIIGGAGAAYLIHRNEDSAKGMRRAYLIIAGVLVLLVAIAIVRGLIAAAAS